jgi:hypothetical protein
LDEEDEDEEEEEDEEEDEGLVDSPFAAISVLLASIW